MNFDFSPVWEGWRALAHGTGITVGITACALLVGCLVGLAVGQHAVERVAGVAVGDRRAHEQIGRAHV